MIIGISGKIGSGKDTVGNIINYLTDYNRFNYTHPTTEKDFNDWLKSNHFLKSNWEIKKFADKLKDIVCLLIGCTREQLEDREFKEKELGEEWWYYGMGKKDNTYTIMIPYLDNGYKKGKEPLEYLIKFTPRKILQLLGTEASREIIHPNIWVNALFADYTPIEDNLLGEEVRKFREKDLIYPNWIITDVRFPNELKAVKDRDGISIRINRLKEGDIVYWDDPEGISSGVYKIKNINMEEAWIWQQDTMAEAQVFPSELSMFKDPDHVSETALDNAKFDYTIDNNGTIENLIEQVKEILIKEEII